MFGTEATRRSGDAARRRTIGIVERPIAVVEFAIFEDEIPAMDYAGPRVVGPGNYVLVQAPVNPDWQPVPGGEPTLELFVKASSADDARRQAERLYAEMRAESRLQEAPRVIATYLRSGVEPVSMHFVDEAYEMLDQQRFEWTVVAAQVACEVEIRAAIEGAAAANPGSLARMAIEIPNSYSLIDRRASQVFEIVLGVKPTQAACWADYRLHVTLRNNIVHRGARATRRDAQTHRSTSCVACSTSCRVQRVARHRPSALRPSAVGPTDQPMTAMPCSCPRRSSSASGGATGRLDGLPVAISSSRSGHETSGIERAEVAVVDVAHQGPPTARAHLGQRRVARDRAGWVRLLHIAGTHRGEGRGEGDHAQRGRHCVGCPSFLVTRTPAAALASCSAGTMLPISALPAPSGR